MSDKNTKKMTIYLVDSENVNDVWIQLATAMDAQDEMLVFYTEKSPHMSYEKVIEITRLPERAVQWIKCVEGSNALDFQLVTELGARVALSGDCAFVIVSNDTGFDAAVKYWLERGKDVRRIKSVECKKLAQALHGEKLLCEASEADDCVEEQRAQQAQEVEQEVLAADTTEQMQLTPEHAQVIAQLGKSIPLSKLGVFHDAFVCLYDQEIGSALYSYLKEHTADFEDSLKKQLPKRKARVKNYVSIVFSLHGCDSADVDTFMEIYNHVGDPKKNLQKLYMGMLSAFGQETGIRYYKLIKKHLKVLMKL